MSPKKLCLVHPTFEKGGAETQILQNLGFFSSNSSLSVILFDDPTDTISSLSAKFPLIKFYTLKKSTGLFGNIRFLWNAISLIKAISPNIIISYLIHANLLCLLAGRLSGAERIIWGLRTSTFSLTEFGLKGAILNFFSIIFSRSVDCLIANNEAGLQQFLSSGARPKRVFTIPNGIDVERYTPSLQERKRCRDEFAISDQAIVIGTVARVVPWKGYETLLKAFATVATSTPGIRLVCVGTGSSVLTHSYRDLTSRLGITDNVIWAGRQEAVGSFLDLMDIFVLPSTSGEGFSNALAEAMAKELPCIATDVGDSKSIVSDCGIVISPERSDQLADALHRLIFAPDLRNSLGAQARLRMIDQYSIEACQRRFFEAIFLSIQQKTKFR
jgi:glycosyltransferase involved in cell wall biosynthesis